jgi:CubicO group peptidase (beta-lactamase class C family)/beta-glucosidase-like glycosyl hydrolase
MVKKVLLTSALCLSAILTQGQDQKMSWVDSVFNKLKVQERIGQLFMLSVSANASEDEIDDLISRVRASDPGGLYLRGGGPVSWVSLYNKIQRVSKVPMIVGMDAEWGVGQTIDSLMRFPRPLAIGAIKNDSLVEALGKEIARQMRVLGVHINFAPNADIHLKGQQASRFFGTSKNRVSQTSIAFVRGLQQNGVVACAKHLFDNENKADLDSTIYFGLNRLDTLDFYPYQQLIQHGVGGLLTSHLHFSIREKRKAVPASVSSLFINQVVKNQFGFSGLLFSEMPYLQSISNKSKGETEMLAFEIGNDFLIDSKDIREAKRRIQKAIKKNPMLAAQLEQSVKKILGVKYEASLRVKPYLNPDNIVRRVNSEEALALKYALTESSITIIQNKNDFLPIQRLEGKKFASLTIGKEAENDFTHFLGKYTTFENFTIRSISDTSQVMQRLKSFDVVVVGIHPLATNFLPVIYPWLDHLSRLTNTVVFSFAIPVAFSPMDSVRALGITYSDDDVAEKIAAQVIFGARQGAGALPYNISPVFEEGTSNVNSKLDRLAYGVPAEVHMNQGILENIKTIAREAIDSLATPGCSILIARKGKVIFEQPMGWQTYDNKIAVTENTIYDLASITKVSATLQTIMFLTERGLIDVNKKASIYLPELKESNKKDFTLKDILTHQAGLWPYLPFWQQTMKDSFLLPEYYSGVRSEDFPYPVAENLFAAKSVKDSLWQWIIRARVRDKTLRTPFDYRYSDMGFYILQHLAEKKLNQPMQDFLYQNLYEPIGASTTGYLPLNKFPPDQIAPTEADMQFRKSTLIGYVHDQGAAMHGGIAGHAGLFSSANDLAKLGQMWLQGGSYGGTRFFRPETIEHFSQQQYESSRRGLGWDKPTQSEWNGPTSHYASPKTFGHTGFTGTGIWIDPEFDLVYIFLSNRVYPDMNNGKLLSTNIRPRIQDVIYRSIFEYCKFADD